MKMKSSFSKGAVAVALAAFLAPTLSFAGDVNINNTKRRIMVNGVSVAVPDDHTTGTERAVVGFTVPVVPFNVCTTTNGNCATQADVSTAVINQSGGNWCGAVWNAGGNGWRNQFKCQGRDIVSYLPTQVYVPAQPAYCVGVETEICYPATPGYYTTQQIAQFFCPSGFAFTSFSQILGEAGYTCAKV